MNKDKDLFTTSEFQKTFVYLFFFLFLIGVITGGVLYGLWGALLGIIAAGLLSLLIAPIIVFIANAFGNAAGSLYTGPQASWTLREQLGGDLTKARHLKSKKEYNAALQAVNGILRKDSGFPEALFLKAQILAEGFSNPESAKAYLRKIIEATQNDATINRWASNYYRGLDLSSKASE